MATLAGISWTAAAGSPEGHYIFAGKVSGIYTHRSSAIPMPALTGSLIVPTTGLWYYAVCGYKTVSGNIVYSPFSAEGSMYTSDVGLPPAFTPTLIMR